MQLNINKLSDKIDKYNINNIKPIKNLYIKKKYNFVANT